LVHMLPYLAAYMPHAAGAVPHLRLPTPAYWLGAGGPFALSGGQAFSGNLWWTVPAASGSIFRSLPSALRAHRMQNKARRRVAVAAGVTCFAGTWDVTALGQGRCNISLNGAATRGVLLLDSKHLTRIALRNMPLRATRQRRFACFPPSFARASASAQRRVRCCLLRDISPRCRCRACCVVAGCRTHAPPLWTLAWRCVTAAFAALLRVQALRWV